MRYHYSPTNAEDINISNVTILNVGNWMTGTEGGTGWDEHWVLYAGKLNSNKKI